MMTITPTAIEAAGLCTYAAMLVGLVAFSIYDIRTKRVPNKGLALFVPVVLACMILRYMAEPWDSMLLYAFYSLAGAVAGGGVLLAAALATKGGIGGGDIKLAALIGLFYGPHGMLLALLAYCDYLRTCQTAAVRRQETPHRFRSLHFNRVLPHFDHFS